MANNEHQEEMLQKIASTGISGRTNFTLHNIADGLCQAHLDAVEKNRQVVDSRCRSCKLYRVACPHSHDYQKCTCKPKI